MPEFSAFGSETVTYTYDARGRLVQVSRSGTVNDGVSASYSYDKADNRTNVTVAGVAGPPSLSVNDVSATEGSPLVFTVTRSGSSSSTVGVSYATSNGTATAGSDYTAESGTLAFATGETSKTVSVTTTDDTTVESAETVTLTLSSPTGGAIISDATGAGTINDNDTAPTCGGVSFTIVSNAAVTEGTNSVFTVTKAGSTSNSCSVSYATANVTATAGSDYTAKSGTLTFTSAQTSKTVSVTTTDDATVESAETFTMSLSSPTGGSTVGTPGSATATLNDNDSAAPPSFSINDASATEGSSVVFTVTKTGTTSSSFSVNYATAPGTASTSDYTSTSGTLSFGPTESTKTISVNTNSVDPKYEMDEIFYVNLSSATGGATISDAQGEGTIYDAWGSLSAPVEETLQSSEGPPADDYGAAPQQSPETTTSDPPPEPGLALGSQL